MDQVFNRAALTELFELETDSPGLVENLVDGYAKTSLSLIGQIETAAATNNFAELKMQAHSLRSSSQVFGLEQLGVVCSRIENDAHQGRIAAPDLKALAPLRASSLDELVRFIRKT